MQVRAMLPPDYTCYYAQPCHTSLPCAADATGDYVRRLLEPAFTTVPAAVDILGLFQSALHISGTPPFPVPNVFFESQRLQNKDMESYLVPVSYSGAITLSSAIHTVLCKHFPVGTEMVQAGMLLFCMLGLPACTLHQLCSALHL